MHNVKPFLLSLLRQAVQNHAQEVRFVSGLPPAMRVAEQLLPCGEVTTSGDMVQSLHEALLAGCDATGQAAPANYVVTLPKFGTFVCQLEVKENAKTLVLRREPNDPVPADVEPRGKLPVMGMRAECDPWQNNET
ncbi:hypothetical protein GCM10027277_56810 [Pseudoduganella ginsengisoli]|uniref:Uncharacterized protein n=1 Tax=Pseudoduganella ginsengisoli TaxID=1462440 RepID=A0A6L6Q378_9BURK|nr:hypothetical protein [Pseudoduganella ginsengisoli]MTW03946.1 hypothetical protein [Pseudoduganella ginsengisoli]